MTTTVRVKASQITKDWHVIDASDRPLGRVASEAAVLLRGKHKPFWEPHLDVGDFVIVINASKVRLTGAKAEQKIYYRHSGYPGGLKSRTFAEQMQRDPGRVIEQAVFGMLPKGSLGKAVRRHLKVYATDQHPHQSQITGSERAIEARKEAIAAARQEEFASPTKPPRLRPFRRADVAAGVPGVAAVEPEEEPVTAAVAAADAPIAETEVEATVAAPETETAEEAPAEETAEPKARRTRAKKSEAEATPADADVESETEAPAKSEE